MSLRITALTTVIVLMTMITGCSNLQKQASNIIKKPSVAVESFKLGAVSEEGITLIPRLKITNENGFPIPVDGMSYDLSLNSRQMISGQNNDIGTLKSKQPKSVDVPVMLTSETLDFFVNSLFKDKKLDYQIKGAVQVLKFDLPFNQSGTFFYPEIKIGKFNLDSANLKEIAGSLIIDVTNKNDFVLPLKSFSYNINANGKQLFSNALSTGDGIPKNGQKSLTIPIKLKPSELGGSLFKMMTTLKADFDVDGVIDMGFSKIPLEKKISVDLVR